METLVVFCIVALAAGYVIRRFFFGKGNACGCGCSGGTCRQGMDLAAKGAGGCCPPDCGRQ